MPAPPRPGQAAPEHAPAGLRPGHAVPEQGSRPDRRRAEPDPVAPIEPDPPSAGLAEALGSIAGPSAAPRPEQDEAEEGLESAQILTDESEIPDEELGVFDREPNEDPLFSGTREIRTNRRAALRRELNEVGRTRTMMVIALVLAVLGAPLTFYAVQEAKADPVFDDIAALEVPDWAARNPQDQATGSRWCIGECKLRQRIMRSERLPDETNVVYTEALKKAGWAEWKIAGCPPEGQNGFETCWQRDEYVLDLYVYQPECEVKLKASDPNQPTTAEAVCPPTVVTLKIINKVSFNGGT